MLSKTRAIVLHSIKYGENKLIIKLYTEHFGVKSFILTRSSTSKKNSSKASLLQPLQPIEIVFKKGKSDSSLGYINEMSAAAHLMRAHTNIVKSSLIIFLNEVLLKSIKEEEEENNALFHFLFQSIVMIDHLETGYENFHLYFLLELTKQLGFYPEGKKGSNSSLFNLKEGFFTESFHADAFSLSTEESALFEKLMTIDLNTISEFKLNYVSRKKLLYALLRYYELHITNFVEPKSLGVLETLLN